MRIENNYTTNYSGDITRRHIKHNNRSLEEVLKFWDETEVGCENGDFFQQKIENNSEMVRYRAKVTTKCGHKRVHCLSIGYIFDDVA